MSKPKSFNFTDLLPWLAIACLLYCFPRYAKDACFILLKSGLIALAFYGGRVACEDTTTKTGAVFSWLTIYLLIGSMALVGLDFLFSGNKDPLFFCMVIAGLIGIGVTKNGNMEK
ncbi:MAG: hypothetical protein ACYC64_15860 [Armatimonadota bacterium]